MHTLQLLLAGFGEVFKPLDLLMMFIGLLIGMAVSIMPGLGLVMGVVLALPFTYGMALEPSIILLTAIYMSGTYAGCFTAILYRIPGEPMDVPLLWDGYAMTQRGEAAKALGWALVAALDRRAGLDRGDDHAGNAAQRVRAQIRRARIFRRSVLRSHHRRRTGGNVDSQRVDQPVPRASGRDHRHRQHLRDRALYLQLADSDQRRPLRDGTGRHVWFWRDPDQARAKPARRSCRPTAPAPRPVSRHSTELWQLRATFVRSTVLGTILGAVPGAGATITSFVSYAIEKQYGRRGDKIGTGIPEGIVAPQIASTASVAGHIVPLLTLGIPGSGATAVILAAFLLHGVQPGPVPVRAIRNRRWSSTPSWRRCSSPSSACA